MKGYVAYFMMKLIHFFPGSCFCLHLELSGRAGELTRLPVNKRKQPEVWAVHVKCLGNFLSEQATYFSAGEYTV